MNSFNRNIEQFIYTLSIDCIANAMIVTETWSLLVTGSPYYIWEEKLRRVKKTLKSWAKTTPPPGLAKSHAASALEIHQSKIEVGNVDVTDI